MTELANYLQRAAATPWTWGSHDCCTFPGGWVLERLGADPVARWRGRYSTEAEAEGLIAQAGGLDRLWSLGLSDIGCAETNEPREGDVGVLHAAGEHGPTLVGGICVGRRWAVLAPAGLFVASGCHVKAWRI